MTIEKVCKIYARSTYSDQEDLCKTDIEMFQQSWLRIIGIADVMETLVLGKQRSLEGRQWYRRSILRLHSHG